MPAIDSDEVELLLPETGETLKVWSDYAYDSDFATPTDAFRFNVGDERIVRSVVPKIAPGTKVSLVINDKVQATGPVDGWSLKAGRSGGTVLSVSGRDALSVLVDSGIDPLYNFTAGQTLNDVFAALIPQFGFKIWSATDLANRSAVTGNAKGNVIRTQYGGANQGAYGIPSQGASAGGLSDTTISGTVSFTETDPTRPNWFITQMAQQLKPHPGEHVFEFLARLCKRLHLWLWSNALGDTVIVDQPDYDQAATYEILRRPNGRVNYEDATYAPSAKDQPTVIFATGFGGGPSFDKIKLKVAIVNELTGLDAAGNILPAVKSLLARYKGIRVLTPRTELAAWAGRFSTHVVRPLYLHDDESRTFGQLDAFVRRELADRQAASFQLNVTVKDHTQNGVPWAVNTIAAIDDDAIGLHDRFWIKSRTFRKSKSGTYTDLVLIPPHTLQFS